MGSFDYKAQKMLRKTKTEQARATVLESLCFGTSARRNIYPLNTPKNRLGNKIVPCRGKPELGPGCYRPLAFDTGRADSRIYSKKGYSCGARTESRFRAPPRNTPAKRTNKQTNKQSTDVTPGAGTYDHDVEVVV